MSDPTPPPKASDEGEGRLHRCLALGFESPWTCPECGRVWEATDNFKPHRFWRQTPPKASTPDTPDFSPEAIAEAIANELVGVRAAPFDLTITEGEAQVVAARIVEYVSSLLAALEASERENERLRGALEGARPWVKLCIGMVYGETQANALKARDAIDLALTPSTPPDPREDA